MSSLESAISKIAQGGAEHLHSLLAMLSREYLLLPVSSKFNLGDEQGTQKVTVPTMREGDRKMIPAFTSEDNFTAWSKGEYQCMSVLGADIVQVVPKNSWLVLNPQNSYSLELSPQELDKLSLIASAKTIDFDIAHANDNISELEENGAELETADEPLSDDLMSDLAIVLKDYSEIAEAYLVRGKVPYVDAIVGILSEPLQPEKRFNVLAEIAEVSRLHFGTAGAIEVFDDLGLESASSWDLFKSLTPFYISGAVTNDLPLSSQIETVVEGKAGANSRPAAARNKTLFSKLFSRT